MEKVKVYFTRDISSDSLINIYKKLGVKLDGKVGVKVSTGEDGAKGYLKKELIAPLVKMLNGTIIECNTAYHGARFDYHDHMKVASIHGFTSFSDVDIMDKDGEFKTVELVVEKLKPEIAWKDDVTFEEITYGETLSADDFAATVAAEFNNKGNILYLENGTAIDIYGNLTAGTHTITAKFVPTDDNYDTNTATATVKVNKAPANVQWSENLDAITYGEKLSETQLCATSAADGVQFTYTVTINGNTISAMGAILPAGDERVINAVLPESDNYEGWNGYRTIKVNPSPTTITWDDPEDIFYGTLLSDEQLNATATAIINGETVTVDGVWTYEPGKNTKLNASDTPQELTVKFTSTDNNFTSVEETKAYINVNKAKPEIVWEPQNVTYGASTEEIAEALENAEAKFNGVSVNGNYEYILPQTTEITK